MVNIAMAQVMVGLVERTGGMYRPEDEAAMGAAQPDGRWHRMATLAARTRGALLAGIAAPRAEIGPRA